MTTPSKSVQVRRIEYANQFAASGTAYPQFYDSQYDNQQNVNVLDEVLTYDPTRLSGYAWNTVRNAETPYTLLFSPSGTLVVSASPSINNFMGSSFTAEFVASTLEINPDKTIEVAGKYGGAGNRGFYSDLYTLGGINYLNVSLDQGVGDFAFYEVIIPNSFTNGSPHHIEIDVDFSGHTIKIFYDGVLCNESGPLQWNLTPWHLNETFPLSFFTVEPVYEAPEFYEFVGNVYWITLSRIAKHSSNFIPPSSTICPPPDPYTLLRFAIDEGTGTAVLDTSGNGNNGTIGNVTWVSK